MSPHANNHQHLPAKKFSNDFLPAGNLAGGGAFALGKAKLSQTSAAFEFGTDDFQHLHAKIMRLDSLYDDRLIKMQKHIDLKMDRREY